MQQNRLKNFLRNGFLWSLLLHLFLFLCIALVLFEEPKESKKPHYYVPSYVYKGGAASAVTPHKNNPRPQRMTTTKESHASQKPLAQTKPVIDEKATDLKAPLTARKEKKPKKKEIVTQKEAPLSMLEASFAALKADQMKSLQRAKDTEPVLLVGDITHVADPIIKLIAQSLSVHFYYPETEGMLGIKGKVIIELILHPDGHFTQIRMLRSSQNHNLDAAALYAANNAPRVALANQFLSKPSRFVVGFVFN